MYLRTARGCAVLAWPVTSLARCAPCCAVLQRRGAPPVTAYQWPPSLAQPLCCGGQENVRCVGGGCAPRDSLRFAQPGEKGGIAPVHPVLGACFVLLGDATLCVCVLPVVAPAAALPLQLPDPHGPGDVWVTPDSAGYVPSPSSFTPATHSPEASL